ncbi:unnamed protein product, partial [Gulo gulo]
GDPDGHCWAAGLKVTWKHLREDVGVDSLSVFAEGSLMRTNQPPKWGKGESCDGGGARGGETLSGITGMLTWDPTVPKAEKSGVLPASGRLTEPPAVREPQCLHGEHEAHGPHIPPPDPPAPHTR